VASWPASFQLGLRRNVDFRYNSLNKEIQSDGDFVPPTSPDRDFAAQARWY